MNPAYYPENGRLTELLGRIAPALDAKLDDPPVDPLAHHEVWQGLWTEPVPQEPTPIDDVVSELVDRLIPFGGRVSEPGFWSFVTTAPSTAPFLAQTAAAMAAPPRYGAQAFNVLEERSLEWLAEIFGLPVHMKGLYSSGGSTSNLVAMGGARQHALETRGIDPAEVGLGGARCAIYVSSETHHTIQRSAAVLGIGRANVREVPIGEDLRMIPEALAAAIDADIADGIIPVAVVANAGATNTGTIDRLRAVGEVARARGVWFHVDGAYGLPGYLDERVRPKYDGLELADSVIVDPHKWMAASTGIGILFARDRALLERAFTQGHAAYLEGSFVLDAPIESSLDAPGIHYADFGVELTAPSRGVQVWAILKEQGVAGLTARIRRDNDFATYTAEQADAHPRLESLTTPDLSVACIRWVGDGSLDEAALNEVNRRIHHRLIRTTDFMPSTTEVRGKLAIRPCFISPRTEWPLVEAFPPVMAAFGDEAAATL